MDVSHKRVIKEPNTNPGTAKKRRLERLTSDLDGKYWNQKSCRRKLGLGTRFQREPETQSTEHNQLAVRQSFDVGLPVVFGQTSFPSPRRKQQSEETFTALQRLGEVLNPETTTLQAYEVEEPDSPPRPLSRQKRLIEPTPGDSTSTWNFVPSWEALCVGARILKQALVLPFAFARFLVDVAPETRSKSWLLEAARREQEQLLLDQWNTERFREPQSSPLSSPPSSPPSSDNKDSTIPAAGSSSSAAPSGSGRTSGGAGSSDTGNTPSNDSNATLLAQIKQLIRLELQRENRADDPEVRDRALRAELHNMDVKRAAIDEERNQIRSGGWTGPTTPLSPTSIYMAPVAMTAGSGPAKPRFNPSDLPSILFGDDLEEWISQIDHIVTSFGELAVCPHILHRCFAVGDPMRDWYLTKPSEVHLFVTTGEGCWDRFKTLLRARFKPDLGVMQFEADSYRKPHGDSWAAFGIRKYRLLKRAYEGSEEANIILKMKAVMDTEVVRFCKEKSSIDGFISELMDYDRTSPAVTRSPGRIFSPESFVPAAAPMQYEPKATGRFLGNQFGNPETGPSASRPSKDKGKAIDRTGQDRKSTIQNRLNPENGRMVRSYLNYQGKPVFIKHACSVCEKNGKPNQMHFSFECNYNTKPRTHIGDVEDPGDKLEVQLYRSESGNLTSYNFQHANASHMTVLYHEDDDRDESEAGNGLGDQ
ncbi:hypothetical protein FN846DRAFT_893270 [Sphaerosporella brunnea]|uniref:Uncharacterized protein n=1 Tax=Sphaerosporella brunnea TaxID=1250544 RepID=A0A5J5ELA1_9PEZI|nr:hypothetical protein FN846DRAFT_893270 [Sphaerosporella brunnea]